MSAFDSRQTTAQLRRLQLLLVAMILWDILAVITALSFGGPLAEIDGDRIGGVLAARVGFSGAVLVPIVMYLYENGFMSGDISFAAAVGWILVVLILAVSVAQVRIALATERA